ncbi:MAG: hypothetical protein WDA47_07575 [Bacilli bacterium]
MILIVEGFDNSGKTVTCKKIQEMIGWPIIHSPGPSDEVADRFLKTLERGGNENLISDRIALVSEEVYGKVLRGQSAFSERITRWAYLLQSVSLGIIYCRPGIEVMFGTLSEREQMEGVVSHRMKLLEQYDKTVSWLIDNTSIKVHVYDYTDPKASTKLKSIVKELVGNECTRCQ